MLPNVLGFIPPALLGLLVALLVAFLLVSGKQSNYVVFIMIPIVVAILMGFSFKEIKTFLDFGVQRTVDTCLLFGTAIMFFGSYSDLGIFDFLVSKLMKRMSNKIEVVLLLTIGVIIVSHLDGSGATTALVAVPTMMPFFDKMKIDRKWLLFYLSVISGTWSLIPWNSTVIRLAGVSGLDPMEITRWFLPALVGGTLIMVALSFFLGFWFRKKGKGMSDEEFAEMKAQYQNTNPVKVSRPKLVFDLVFVVVLILALLLGWVNSVIAFYIAFVVCMVVNYPSAKEQIAQVRKLAPSIFNMILCTFAVAMYIGFLNQAGLAAAMGQGLVTILPISLQTHLLLIYALFAFVTGLFLDTNTQYMVIVPILVSTVGGFFGDATWLYAMSAVTTGVICALNINPSSPTPYLSLGLANIDVKDHIKFSAPRAWAYATGLVVIMVLFGRIPL